MIAVDQDKALNPPKMISKAGTSKYAAVSMVLAKALSDGSVAVGMFNRGGQPLRMFVNWKSLGLVGKTIKARDLWAHTSVKVSADGYAAYVPKHGVIMLKVSEK